MFKKLLLMVCLMGCFLGKVCQAEHPSAPQLLPERTEALLRIPNVPEFRQRFKDTSLGRILRDEEVGPLVSKFYDNAKEMYERIESEVGVPLERLMTLPQGEFWIAVVPSQTGGAPAVAILLDVKDEILHAQRLLDRGEAYLAERGGRKLEDTIAGTRVNVFLPAGVDEPRLETRKNKDGVEVEVKVGLPGTFVQWNQEGALLFTSSLELATDIMEGFAKKERPTLAANQRYTAVMNKCAAGHASPDIEWYIDPIALIKDVSQGNLAAQSGLALVPALGLDGLQALGGTATMGSGEFDDVQHMHLLLENPRSGVLEVIALQNSEMTPQAWVPADIVSYSTSNWDVPQMFAKGSKLYDSFFGEGKALDELKRRATESLDLDFETEILGVLQGRVTHITWMEPPARLNSQCNAVGLSLTDPQVAAAALEKIAAKYPERMAKQMSGKTTYYALEAPMRRQRERRREQLQEAGQELREPEPCVAIVGNDLLVTDSLKFLEHCLAAVSSGKCLSEELDYKLVAGKAQRQAGGSAGAILFSRPEEALKNLYSLASGPAAMKLLEKQAEQQEAFARLHKTLQEHPLPPFTVIAKYLAPSGAVVTQDETGFHYQVFTLRRK